MDQRLLLYLFIITTYLAITIHVEGLEILTGKNYTECPEEGPPCQTGYCAPNSPVCNHTIITPGTVIGTPPTMWSTHAELFFLIATIILFKPQIMAWIEKERRDTKTS